MCCIFVLYLCKCSTITNHDEHFTEESTKSIELNENIYTDTKHNLRDKLIFYVSVFNLDLINKNVQIMTNAIDNGGTSTTTGDATSTTTGDASSSTTTGDASGALVVGQMTKSVQLNVNGSSISSVINTTHSMNVPHSSDYIDYITKTNGITLNNTQEVMMPSTKELLIQHRNFSVFFLMKINQRSRNTSRLNFYKIPMHDSRTNNIFMTFSFEFIRVHNLNPDIVITVFNQEFRFRNDSNTLSELFSKNMIFNDERIHMFTFTKHNSDIKLILDNYIDNPLITSTVTDNIDFIHTDAENISMNYKSSTASSPLDMQLFAHGIYNVNLNNESINELFLYFTENLRLNDPAYISILQDRDHYKNLYLDNDKCPFSKEEICVSDNCKSIQNWNDVNQLLLNDRCFAEVVDYCSKTDIDKTRNLCKFLNTDTINKMNITLNGRNSIDNKLTDEDMEMLNKIKKLELTDIYLDKSVRSKGSSKTEMINLIDALLQDKDKLRQLKDLYDADAEKASELNNNIRQIDYDTLGDTDMNMSYDSFIKNELSNKSSSNVQKNSNDTIGTIQQLNYDSLYDGNTSVTKTSDLLSKREKDHVSRKLTNNFNLFGF